MIRKLVMSVSTGIVYCFLFGACMAVLAQETLDEVLGGKS